MIRQLVGMNHSNDEIRQKPLMNNRSGYPQKSWHIRCDAWKKRSYSTESYCGSNTPRYVSQSFGLPVCPSPSDEPPRRSFGRRISDGLAATGSLSTDLTCDSILASGRPCSEESNNSSEALSLRGPSAFKVSPRIGAAALQCSPRARRQALRGRRRGSAGCYERRVSRRPSRSEAHQPSPDAMEASLETPELCGDQREQLTPDSMAISSRTVSDDTSPIVDSNSQLQNYDSRSETLANSTEDLSSTEASAGETGRSGGTQSPECILKIVTYALTEEQVTDEAHGIYAGLKIVEDKCSEICRNYSDARAEISPFQWQPLISLFRTLLREHHDFYLACAHPDANPSLAELPEKLEMPRRLWYIGIFGLLELQRRRLPESLEHMLSFMYEAYYMLTTILETVPRYEEVWMECLGDLARCRMRLELGDVSEYGLWAEIARYWYNKTADKMPNQGRLQHHLAVLAQTDIVLQLFLYTKSITSVLPFTPARERFLPFCGSRQKQDQVAMAFVSVHGQVFTRGVTDESMISAGHFLSNLENHIGLMGVTFRLRGVHIMCSNFAAMFAYGHADAILPIEFNQSTESANIDVYKSDPERWTPARRLETIKSDLLASKDSAHSLHLVFTSLLTFKTFSIALDQIGNKNVYPTVHVTLAFILCLADSHDSLRHVEAFVPWSNIARFLNTMIRDDTDVSAIEREDFPIPEDRKQLPEDFCARSHVWSRNYYPSDFFEEYPEEHDGRWVETPSLNVSRAYRCLWVGVRIAQVSCRNTSKRSMPVLTSFPVQSLDGI